MKSKVLHINSYKIAIVIIIFIGFIFSSIVNADKNVSIIIVGAGPSGIAAATRLQENGFNEIKILEAENRFGGRVNSVKFGDAFVDLGAEFCHGEENNVVYQLTKKYNILKSTNRRFEMVYSTGEEIDQEFAKELYGFVDLYETLDRNSSDYYITIGDFFLKEYKTHVLDKYENDKKKRKIYRDAINTLESAVCYLEGCFSWFTPTLNNPYEKCPGDLELNWNGLGYKTILEIMMRTYPEAERSLHTEARMFLNSEVTKIDMEGDKTKISVSIKGGDIYTADHVIYTTSIGVLKEKHRGIFVPELPEKKIKCIEKLGINAIMKVYLHFPQKWWDGNFVRRMFVWSEEDRKILADQFSSGPVKGERSWIGNVYHLRAAPNNPNVLVLWIIGEFVPDLETAADKTIQDGAMFVIHKFLGGIYNITQPNQMIHSSWYNNEHFRGTYSYDTVDSLKLGYNCHEELAEPVYDADGIPRILFAGEATNPIHYSTVHGAIETGYREANRIIEYYEQ